MNWIVYAALGVAAAYLLLKKNDATPVAAAGPAASVAVGARVMLNISPSVAAMFRDFDPTWTKTGHVCATVLGPVDRNGALPVAVDGLRVSAGAVTVSQQNIVGPC